MTSSVLDLHGISKGYGGLRPLRVERLNVSETDRVAILGFDRPMAEVFVNLVTGATLPDSGTVTVFGRRTSDIADSSEWLSVVDRFGIVSQRVVLLEGMTAIQNLALAFTLDIEPPTGEALRQAEALASEVALPKESWQMPVAQLDDLLRASLRLARAIALEPGLLLLEHPTSALDRVHVAEFATRLTRVLTHRATAAVALTADEVFADAFPGRTLKLIPATGEVAPLAARRWSRRLG